MGRIRQKKKKQPITQPAASAKQQRPSSLPDSASSQTTRGIIRRFHVLNKQKARLQKATEKTKTALRAGKLKAAGGKGDVELAEIEGEMEALGGLERYQAMSSIGQSGLKGGGSEKVLVKWLKEIYWSNVDAESAKGRGKLELLDVGALKHDNYKKASSLISATPIDLHSRHPQIVEQDFMQISPGEANPHNLSREWDVISLSLVLNFVPDARERGRMLHLAHMLLKKDGLLFVVLPLPCVVNSRYLTIEHWTSLMKAVGFDRVKEQWKPTGKVGYWLFRKTPRGQRKADYRDFEKKAVLREGSARNNFCILLDLHDA
ncbi:hypothetical protein PIIN_01880 [Serendipita indica DSM 11827]|uniref:25S rRNA adenine-N(1) methyltransferase n=1 Tax=Serendipita indica (strain DSM 11827) TaxID=1109443 RepID=G4T9M0_SERID|nr:hypothetical protein PIIN_01880 [Serendipita indica DSM 11827]